MFNPDADRFHEECGVVGVFGHPEAANLAYLALYALQRHVEDRLLLAIPDVRVSDIDLDGPVQGGRRRRERDVGLQPQSISRGWIGAVGWPPGRRVRGGHVV